MVDMVDMEAMVDTAAREKPNHTTDTEVVMVDTVESVKPKLPQLHTMEVMVDTDMVDTVDTDTVDTVENVKPKLPQNHTTEAMVDTVMVDMVDTDTVDTVESVKPNHTTDMEAVMVDMVDTDTVDTLMASKRLISNISPFYISPTLNLESFTKIQDNMY